MNIVANEEVSNNISNAFKVVHQTYKNLEKLFSDLDSIGGDEGFVPITPKFLRYRSDNDIDGWLIRNFIKLYQRKNDSLIKGDSGLRNGPLYMIEVDFEGEKPQLRMSKLYYEDLHTWVGISVTDHWSFYNPFRDRDNFVFDSIEKYSTVRPNNDKARKGSLNLKIGIFINTDLVKIDTSEKIRLHIFGVLKELDNVNLNI